MQKSLINVMGIVVFGLFPCLAQGAAAASGFDLLINDVSGLHEPWPLIGGLPFPEGMLRDAAQIRVVDGAGKEVPAQIDVAATWRDGSIRWALAGLHADPRGKYRVEYGPGVSRAAPAQPLVVKQSDDGAITVDTGAAQYEFLPDRLLPDTARMGDTVFLSDAGAGAYLVDNQGRLARVAGDLAEIETEIVKQGPVRTVIRREGWYVTGDGAKIARARVWFYLTAGSPYLRITHSLVFTEDTNDLWVRDYGLEFNTPQPAREAVFAVSEATWTDEYTGGRGPEDKEKLRELAEMFSSGLYEREQRLFSALLNGDEVYMLQDNYPHVLERKFRAVIARAKPALDQAGSVFNPGNLWIHPWLQEMEVVGDWAEARFGEHALMVVVPQQAQRFPKEIAFGPSGARVALWSGRSGRELDFRAVTLVNEYWQSWANNANHPFGLSHLERGPAIGTRIAEQPSNARGAARTHDVWLLPRAGNPDEQGLKARGLAAAHQPLLQADPAWLGSSGALWPFHQKDTERFPAEEQQIAELWGDVLGNRFGHAELRRSGFIMWGMNVTLGTGPRWFRLSQGAGHYRLDFITWLLYMRSGERRYYDYARHFARFSGDLNLAHWTAGNRFRGGFASAEVHLPFYWGDKSKLGGAFWTLGWMLDYYLTGDEYVNELLNMVADAYREHENPGRYLGSYTHNHLYNLSVLYEHTRDEKIRELARQAALIMIDLDNPIGLNDRIRYGAYYKTSTEWLFPLYIYYKATGDETAKEVILRAMDDKFRFFYTSNQTFRLFLFAEAYRWTGNPAYLSLVKLMLESPHFGLMGHNYLLGAPTALYAIAQAAQPIEPFPVLAVTSDEKSVVRNDFTGVIMDHEFIEGDTLPPVIVRKNAGKPVQLSVFVRMSDDSEAGVVALYEPAGRSAQVEKVQIVKSQRFITKSVGRRDPRRWHFYLTLPAELPAGDYAIAFPKAATMVVLESDAEDIRLGRDGG